MNKFIALTACATLALSTPALADTNDFVITHHELAFAFDDIESLQATAMTDAEMADTQGAWAANAVGGIMGGVGGHFSYMANSVASGSYNRNAHLMAIGGGALAGTASPIRGATSFVHGARNVALGTVASGVSGYIGTTGKTINIR